jgi:hypothetical protein
MKLKQILLIPCFILTFHNPVLAQSVGYGSSYYNNYSQNMPYWNNYHRQMYNHSPYHSYHHNNCHNNYNPQPITSGSRTRNFLYNYVFPLFNSGYGSNYPYPNEFQEEYNTNSNVNYGTSVRILD